MWTEVEQVEEVVLRRLWRMMRIPKPKRTTLFCLQIFVLAGIFFKGKYTSNAGWTIRKCCMSFVIFFGMLLLLINNLLYLNGVEVERVHFQMVNICCCACSEHTERNSLCSFRDSNCLNSNPGQLIRKNSNICIKAKFATQTFMATAHWPRFADFPISE